MRLRRLHPTPGELTAEEATSGFDFGRLAPPERPYVVLNMIATLDGRITIDGRSGPIGGAADRDLFLGLRTQGEAVMAGAGTVRNERYGRIVRAPERRRRRVQEGLAPDPLAVVVSGRLDLPADLPLLQDRDSRVVVLTAAQDRELPPVAAQVDYLRGNPATALRPLLERLRREHGVRSIVCEGGPHLNAALIREDLVDELFLSLAPKIAGGAGPALLAPDAPAAQLRLALLSVLEAEDTLFMRYRVEH